MLERLFPAKFDNAFPGKKISLWVFYLLTAVTLWRSQHHMLAADGGAQSIATMPLDTYSAGARENIIAIFGQWGLTQLLLGLLMLLAATRYRSMVPLMWLIAMLEYGGRMLVGSFKPIVTLESAPGQIANLPVLAIAALMLVLSLWPGKRQDA